MWSVANATCTALGYQSAPPAHAEGALNDLLNIGIRRHNWLFWKSDEITSKCLTDAIDKLNFAHPNVSLQLCRHRPTRQILIGHSKLTDRVFFLSGANRLALAGLSPITDDSHTFGLYKFQSWSISKTASIMQFLAHQNWPTYRIPPPQS